MADHDYGGSSSTSYSIGRRSRSLITSFSQIKLQYCGRKLQVRPDDLNTRDLAKIFHLIPETIILISQDDSAIVPDESGKFCNVDDFVEWTVEGEQSTLGQSGSRTLSGQSSEQPTSSWWKPSSFPTPKQSHSRSVSDSAIFYIINMHLGGGFSTYCIGPSYIIVLVV